MREGYGEREMNGMGDRNIDNVSARRALTKDALFAIGAYSNQANKHIYSVVVSCFSCKSLEVQIRFLRVMIKKVENKKT